MDGSKKVSVVVPTYNQAQYLPLALDSILEQTYENWEAVVVNDGSSDETPGIVDEYARRDARFKSVHQPNGGISSALNHGLELASGDYFCWLSSDDLFLPPKLATQVAAFERNHNAGMIVSGFNHVDPDGRILGTLVSTPEAEINPAANLILHGNFINGCTVMIPMRIMRQLGGFNARYRYAQDYEMWARVALQHRIVWVPEVLVSYRVHPGQGSATGEVDCLIDSLVVIDEILRGNSAKQVAHIALDKGDGVDRFIEYMVYAVAWQHSWINFPQINRDVWEWVAANLRHRLSPVETAQLLGGVAQFLAQNVHHRHVPTNLSSLSAVVSRIQSIQPFSARIPADGSPKSNNGGAGRKPARVAMTATRAMSAEAWSRLAAYANALTALGVHVGIYLDDAPPQSAEFDASVTVIGDDEQRYGSIREPLILVSSLAEIPAVYRQARSRTRVVHLCVDDHDVSSVTPYRDGADPSAQVEYLRRLPLTRILTSNSQREYFQTKNREESYWISAGDAVPVFSASEFDRFVRVLEDILETVFDRDTIERVRASIDVPASKEWKLEEEQGSREASSQ